MAGRKLTGEASAAEQEELRRLLEDNEEWRRIYQTLFTKGKTLPDEQDALSAQQAYAALFVRMQLAGEFEKQREGTRPEDGAEQEVLPVVRKKGGIRIYSIAASILLFLSLGAWWYVRMIWCKRPAEAVARNEIVTQKGFRSKAVLPDGTQVWLNADSRIVYQDNFKGAVREVQLTGEALFDVVKDPSRPFVIHAGPIDIHVLGTRFNIRSYPQEKKIETLLLRGAIEVTVRNQHNRKILLRPNEKLSVPNDSILHALSYARGKERFKMAADSIFLGKGHFERSDSSNIETLWAHDKLAFEGEPLEMVAVDLERWYNAKVIIRNDKLKSLRFTGVFDNWPLQEVMEVLKLTGRFNYTISADNEVVIY